MSGLGHSQYANDISWWSGNGKLCLCFGRAVTSAKLIILYRIRWYNSSSHDSVMGRYFDRKLCPWYMKPSIIHLYRNIQPNCLYTLRICLWCLLNFSPKLPMPKMVYILIHWLYQAQLPCMAILWPILPFLHAGECGDWQPIKASISPSISQILACFKKHCIYVYSWSRFLMLIRALLCLYRSRLHHYICCLLSIDCMRNYKDFIP